MSIISFVVVHRVTKEVDADSREAKSFLKNEEKALKQKEEVSEPQASVPLSSESRYHPASSLYSCILLFRSFSVHAKLHFTTIVSVN